MFARLEPKQHTAMVVRTKIDKAVNAVYPNSSGVNRVQGIVNPDPRMRCGMDVASLIGDKFVCTHNKKMYRVPGLRPTVFGGHLCRVNIIISEIQVQTQANETPS